MTTNTHHKTANRTLNQADIGFYAIVGLLGLTVIILIIAAIIYTKNYQNKIMSELKAYENIESLSIQKNGYENVFSFDGFIEDDSLSDIYNVLNQSDDIESAWSSIDFPAFLSIRKASIYVDMMTSQELGSDNITQGRMYNDGGSANEVVIGSTLSTKYGIPHNSIVAIIVKDFDDVYSVTNLYVSGISHFENDESKNNKAYISPNKFKTIMAISNDYDIAQKINITIKDEGNISETLDYLYDNIDTNLFSINQRLIRDNIITDSVIKESSKLIMVVFMIAIILTICSIMRIMLFRIKE